MDSAFRWVDHYTAYKPYQNQLSHPWHWFNRFLALSTFSTIGAWFFLESYSPANKVLIYACEVNGTLCIDWLRGTVFLVSSGGKAISSMNDLREAHLKRERERERLLVMSSWPDDGALVMRWKKANEARRTKLPLMIFCPESSKECFFLNLFFQSLWAYSGNSKNSRHTYATLFSYACNTSSNIIFRQWLLAHNSYETMNFSSLRLQIVIISKK